MTKLKLSINSFDIIIKNVENLPPFLNTPSHISGNGMGNWAILFYRC